MIIESTNLEIALISYLIDFCFGEFISPHPVVLMGRYINWFEKRFYKDRVVLGVVLGLSLVLLVGIIAYLIYHFLIGLGAIGVVILGIVASATIANKMLYDSVKDIITNPQNIRFLVSRDSKNLSREEINRAGVETYSENLSDGVIAPLLYLVLFGVVGAFVYKAINTLDSMVGYKNEKYERFGKFSARLDDVANYLPSRVTAFLIAILSFKRESFDFFRYARAHDSPNAGYPISAMALALGVRLGGSSYYFGKLRHKPFFGRGRAEISVADIKRALSFKKKIDIFVIGLIILSLI